MIGISKYAGFIDNRFITGEGNQLDVANPAEGQVFASIRGLSLKQVEAAIVSARQAFERENRSGLPAKPRVNRLRQSVDALNYKADKLAEIVVAETGCPPHTSVLHAQVKSPLSQAEGMPTNFIGEGMGKSGMARQSMGRAHPLGRPIEPEECAGVALFLASDLASNITGGNLPMDGGLSAGVPK